MKKMSAFCLLLVMMVVACNPTETYYDEVIKNKTISERIVELNQSLTAIRKTENKKALIKEDDNYLEYEYKIGNDDTYHVTYFFDAAGCFEVGLDTYFGNEIDAQQVLDEIKREIEADSQYGVAKNTNSLYEWTRTDGAVSIELDYINVDKGMIAFTIFANE